jgi:Asp-tRNA(Asn)/Glu-tRNA(Gln) amidotransferase A subunit family amidase
MENHVPRNDIDEWVKGLYNPKTMEGLDIGIQIIGRRYQEELVLGVASVLERLMSVPRSKA